MSRSYGPAFQSSSRPRLRSFASLLVGLACVAALGGLPAACQSGGVGDPCVPEDEEDPAFAGFDPAEENIESRSFQCETRICLVNHFQGRVSCPLGQEAPVPCASPDDTSCPEGKKCVEADVLDAPCDPGAEGGGGCEAGSSCDPVEKRCKRYVCHATGACQVAGMTEGENQGKDCCVPGSDRPVSASVCGQCEAASPRSAERSVYCSCRCGPPDGAQPEEGESYCECPNGYECSEIRKDYGLGDKQLAGKYCIKQGSAFTGVQACGAVSGYFETGRCAGLESSL